jgi:precorrin-2/cobalt-factor-2 C20-methyltransferase
MDGFERLDGPTEEIPAAAVTGTLYGVGMGPGDPELLTVKAQRILMRAPVLVHFCKRGRRGNARTIADAILSEGDPFFYGSFMHLWRRLKDRFPVEVVPGVTGMSGCWTRAGTPITWGDDVLTVLPATLSLAALTERLRATDAAVVMKLGRHLPKVRAALAASGLLERAVYVERGTMAGERVVMLADKADDDAPYFSMVLLPGEGRRS